MKSKTRKFLNLCTLILIIIIWSYFPYTINCLNCSGKSDFWWNLPFSSVNYQGILWEIYFLRNSFFTFLVIFISQFIVIIASKFDHFRIENIRLFIHNQLFIDENKYT